MQEVLENAQKQAKEDKSKHMQKKRHNQDEIKEITPENVVVNNSGNCEQTIGPEPGLQQKEPEPSEPKEISKLPEVDATHQTISTPLNRQKLLTPSKFRNQTTSIAVQTEISR